MTRIIVAILVALWWFTLPAGADYPQARARFDILTDEQQKVMALALIATGDFDGLVEQGFTPRLYHALRAFQAREGFYDDGVLDREQLQRLEAMADDFYAQLGSRTYSHPESGARLLVPRALFDDEKPTPDGILFTRRDGVLSLLFLSVPASRQSYDDLWRTLSTETPDKQVIYQRRFASRFVVTGIFRNSKFYTMMARSARGTTGFTFSWGAPMEEMGRKVSSFLANAYLAQLR